MNNSKKVFMVLVLAGMFLLPPAAALETGSPGESDAQSPSQTAAPPAVPRSSNLLRPFERNSDAPGEPALASLNRGSGEYYPIMTSGNGGSRGPRAAPDIYPAAFAVVPPDPIRGWRNSEVVASKNAVTQFNLTVNNSGDADATPATVTFKFFDVEDKLLDQSVQTGDIVAGSNATFYFQFKPAFCTYFYINITVSASGDLNPADNAIDLGYFAVTIWADDCTINNGWTGDLANAKWHITDTPENDDPTQHSAPNCWYEGRDALVGQDSYDPNQDISIKTQTIDLRNFGHQYYLMIDYQFHGQLPVLDAGDYFENMFSTDNGATWSRARVHVSGPWIGPTSMPDFRDGWLHWVTQVTGGSITGLDITQYAGKMLQMKMRFVSNEAVSDWGMYFDDFAVWGVEIFNDTRIDLLTDVADMKVNEKKDFDVKITNMRQGYTTGFNCSFNLTKRGEPLNQLPGSTTKQVPALGTGQSQNVQFSWTPSAMGDYILVFSISGMPDQDSSNNRTIRWAHVSGPNPRILIVDDDPYVGYTDYTSKAMYDTIVNVTGKTADERPYADYGVYYTWWKRGDAFPDWGGDGPSAALMSKYDAVIWLTGTDSTNKSINGTLTANDQTSLTTYLNSGGSLWLSSMGVMNDLGLNTFTRSILHVDSVRNDTLLKPTADTHVLPSPIVGVAGSLAEGASYYTMPPTSLDWTFDQTDLIKPDASAQGVFLGNTSTPADPWYVAIQYKGASYRSVFQSFDYAWIAFESPDRQQYTKNVLNFLMGGLEMQVVGQNGTAALKKMVDPGGTAVFTVSLMNTGTKDREIDNITLDPVPQGWTAVVDPDVKEGSPTTTIKKGETLDITITVTAPVKGLAGERADLGMNVSFKIFPGILFNRTITEVNPIVKVELSAPNTVQNVTGAGSVSYPFTLRNLGNMQLTADLQKTGEHFEWLQLSVSQVLLNAYEEKNLTAMMSIPEGAYRQAGNYSLTTALTARVNYLEKSSNSTLNLTTNIRVAQVFGAKIDDVELTPSDGQVDMSLAKPSAKVAVTVSSAKGNGYDNISVELKAKSFAPTTGTGTGPSRSWDGAGWGLNLAGKVVETTPFMTVGKQATLTVFVPLTAEAGEFTIEVRAIPGSGKLADGDSTTITVKVTKPDLQFGGTVSFTPKEPEVGTTVKVKVAVKNLGGAKASSVDVAFYDSGSNLIETKTLTELGAGATQNVEIEWTTFTEGENLVTVRLDPDSKISEISKENNEITETVVGQRSDLQLDGEPVFKVGGLVKTQVKSGDTVQVEITVKNVGTWGLNLTSVQVRLTDQTTNEVLTETISSLPTRSEAKVTFMWAAKKDGTHTISIKVNPDGAIKEKDLNNNEATGTIKVFTPTVNKGLDMTMLAAIGGIVAVVVIVAAVMMMRKKKPAAAPSYPPVSSPPEEPVAVVAEEVPPPPPPPQGPPVMR
jgi:uncharacterized membrane protein